MSMFDQREQSMLFQLVELSNRSAQSYPSCRVSIFM